ncbi:GNAT family N-acetyltransferase [Mesonia aquimarina]|uniref:GNAT family N-acetyltransferase n=1 Tax=Mesonia aquimarina TaxID=1504967 RepID=UPI000EF6063E|nr:GNAT family N-acetyltransferase [Mesonia aquimarina]
MDFNLRKAQKKDSVAILKLIEELAVFEKEPDAVELTKEDIERDGFGENPLFTCFVAEVNKQVQGMALCYFRYSTWKGKTVHLEDLIIRESYRNKGLGKALYKRVMEFALENKVKRVEWVVLDWNINAVNFYKNSGATVFEEWNTVQFSDDAIRQFLQ